MGKWENRKMGKQEKQEKNENFFYEMFAYLK
jgi:hypothetical protein